MSVRTKPWELNNNKDDDEYEDCCGTDDVRWNSSMHVCRSQQQSRNCTYHVHKYSCTSNRIHLFFFT